MKPVQKRRRRDTLDDLNSEIEEFVRRRDEEEEEERKHDPHWQLHYEERMSGREPDPPDPGPIRGYPHWTKLKEHVKKFLHPHVYKEFVRAARRVRSSLQHCPTERDTEMYLVATLTRDMSGTPYARLPYEVDGGFPIDQATYRANAHVLRKAFAEWAKGEVLLGTCKDWEAAARHRQLPEGVNVAAYLIMDVRDFPLAIKGGENDLFRSEWALAQRCEEFEHDNSERGHIEWLAKRWSPGLRYLFVFDLHHVIRFIDGPFSPRDLPSDRVSAMAARFDSMFAGATIIADSEFYGVQGLSKVMIDAPKQKAKKSDKNIVFVKEEEKEESSGSNSDGDKRGQKETRKKPRKTAAARRIPAAATAPLLPTKLPPRGRQMMFFRDVGRVYSWWARHWKALGHDAALPLADGEEQHACLLWYTIGIWNAQLRL